MAEASIVTLLFTDLVRSTERIDRLGDDAAEEVRRTHFQLLRDAVTAHRGEEVKNLGDACDRALRELDQRGQGDADEKSKLDLLLRLGDTQWRAGEADQARQAFLAAVEVARRRSATEQFARAVLGFVGPGDCDKAADLLTQALATAERLGMKALFGWAGELRWQAGP